MLIAAFADYPKYSIILNFVNEASGFVAAAVFTRVSKLGVQSIQPDVKNCCTLF